jgi:ribonuclease HII
MLVCGVDEAGRGPLAGPVTAAAVILPGSFPPGILADSKALTPERRSAAAELIRERAVAWATGWAWPEEIDHLNIHVATLLAMTRALAGLSVRPELVLVDGLFTPPTSCAARAIVAGDQKVAAIMAASILAKTERDLWMIAYSQIEPRYRFDQHKGYPTPEHRELVERYGFSAIHRRSFRTSGPG